jgi:zinc D-Ala-D-Ala carboxypeptidase
MTAITGMVSTHFHWAETYASELAERHAIDNTPPDALRLAIIDTAASMDRVRRLLGAPVLVSSWYRCLELNRLLGSQDSSQHLSGRAVDFRSPAFGPPARVFDFLRALRRDIDVDQLILEYPQRPSGGWVHISFTETPRHQALVIDDNGTRFA